MPSPTRWRGDRYGLSEREYNFMETQRLEQHVESLYAEIEDLRSRLNVAEESNELLSVENSRLRFRLDEQEDRSFHERVALEDENQRLRRDLDASANISVGHRRSGGSLQAKIVSPPKQPPQQQQHRPQQQQHKQARTSSRSPLRSERLPTREALPESSSSYSPSHPAEEAARAAAQAAAEAAADRTAAAAERAAAAADRAAAERAAAAAQAAAEAAAASERASTAQARAEAEEAEAAAASARARERLRSGISTVIEGFGSPEERKPKSAAVAAIEAFKTVAVEKEVEATAAASERAKDRLRSSVNSVIEGMGGRGERRAKDPAIAAAEVAAGAFKDVAATAAAAAEAAAAPARARERLRSSVNTVIEGMGVREERKPKNPAMAAVEAFKSAASPPKADGGPAAVDLAARLASGPPSHPAPTPPLVTPKPAAISPPKSAAVSPSSPAAGGWSPTTGRAAVTPKAGNQAM